MTNFNEREQAFEQKFAADAEKAFKAKARRDVRLAEWAADQMSYGEDKKESYVSVIGNDFLEQDIDALVARIQSDLEKENVTLSAIEIFKKAEELLGQVYQELSEGV